MHHLETTEFETASFFEPCGSYREHQGDRSGFQRVFAGLLAEDPRVASGPVLEVGCGGAFHPVLKDALGGRDDVDGVDPFPEVLEHPGLRKRWQGPIEEVDIPPFRYTAAVAYNVLEHIEEAEPFLAAVRKTLAPGGVFYALTPHANHPFARISRGIEVLGGKSIFSSRSEAVNDYPAYYRLNRRRSVVRAMRGLGFSSATFWHVPCAQWDTYFPRPIKFAPRLWDRAVGLRFASTAAILLMRLEVLESVDASTDAAELPA